MSLGIGGDVVARIKAVVEVDTKGLKDGLREAEQQAHSSGSKIGTGLKVAGTVAAAGIGIAVAAVGESVKAAIQYQKVQSQLKVSLKNAGLSWKQYGGRLDDTIKKQSELSGFTENDLTSSYARLITVTHNVAAAHKSVSLAMDVSRATGKPLSATTLLLMKAYNGSNTALSRLGIVIPKVTKAQDKLKASGKSYTTAQMAAAKAADLRSQREENLSAIQKKFGGSSAAYAKTAAGEWDRFTATLEIVETEVGEKLLPVLTKVLTWLLEVAQSKGAHQVIEDIGKAFSMLWQVAQPILGDLKKGWAELGEWFKAHSAQIQDALNNVENIFHHVFNAIRTVIQIVMPTIKKEIVDQLHIVRDVVIVILDVISGHWGKAWQDMKRLLGDVLRGAYDLLRGAVSIVGQIAVRIGSAILHGIVSGISGLLGAIRAKIEGALSSLANGVQWVISKVTHIGGAIVTGIVDGIANAAGEIATAIENALPKHIHIGPVSIPTGLATGGIVSGGVAGRDSVPAMLTPGEMVLNKAQQSRLAGLLGVPGGSGNGAGLGSGVTIHNHFTQTPPDTFVHLRRAKLQAGAVFGS